MPSRHAAPATLTCRSAHDLRALYPIDSLEWRAEEAIAAIEKARRSAEPVPFYLYDNLTIHSNTEGKPRKTFTIESTLATLERCGAPSRTYHYGAAHHFLRQLVEHPWRTRDASAAALFVIPTTQEYQMARGRGGQPRLQYCKGLLPPAELMAAIAATASWSTRGRDHVYVTLDWEMGALPLSVGTDARRAFVETAWSAPNVDLDIWKHPSVVGPDVMSAHGHLGHGSFGMLHACVADSHAVWRKQHGAQADASRLVPHEPLALPPHRAVRNVTRRNVLIAAPYVDNGNGHSPSTLAANWAAEHRRAFGGATDAPRDVKFFFGGRTGTRIGPGRKQCGYYPRWHLMRSWQLHELRRQREGAAGLRSGAAKAMDELRVIDSDRLRENPAAAFCPNRSALAYAPPPPPSPPPGAEPMPCVPPCDAAALAAPSGACFGHYSPSAMLLRSRFALCLRGDIPSSPRPYDAMRYGAIPVLVSDAIYRVGLPFQCLVPWRIMTLSIAEGAWLDDAGAALDNATRGLHPAAEARMRQLIAHFGRDVLWRHPHSRVAENILRVAAGTCCPIEDEIT